MGLLLQEGLEQVIGADGPAGDELKGIAMLGGPDLGRDLTDFLVELQWLGAGRIGGQEEHLDLVHRLSGCRTRSPRESSSRSSQRGLRRGSLLRAPLSIAGRRPGCDGVSRRRGCNCGWCGGPRVPTSPVGRGCPPFAGGPWWWRRREASARKWTNRGPPSSHSVARGTRPSGWSGASA